MTDTDTNADEDLARGWIAYWQQPPHLRGAVTGSASDLVYEMAEAHPQRCYRVILRILKHIDAAPGNALFQVLAAGPLEHLLANNGPQVIDAVEVEAQRDPRLALLLGGVWQDSIPQEIRRRVAACSSQAW
jgi:hypothetical protein